MLSSGPKSVEPDVHHTVEFARCFLRLANLPNFALDRLSRYEATLWRQVAQIMFALDAWIPVNHGIDGVGFTYRSAMSKG